MVENTTLSKSTLCVSSWESLAPASWQSSVLDCEHEVTCKGVESLFCTAAAICGPTPSWNVLEMLHCVYTRLPAYRLNRRRHMPGFLSPWEVLLRTLSSWFCNWRSHSLKNTKIKPLLVNRVAGNVKQDGPLIKCTLLHGSCWLCCKGREREWDLRGSDQ